MHIISKLLAHIFLQTEEGYQPKPVFVNRISSLLFIVVIVDVIIIDYYLI